MIESVTKKPDITVDITVKGLDGLTWQEFKAQCKKDGMFIPAAMGKALRAYVQAVKR